MLTSRSALVAYDEEGFDSSTSSALVGASREFRAVMRQIRQVAAVDTTVLVLGETGTGKERITGAIHEHSRRAGKPYVRVNCGAIPPALVAGELFGHERGAFTGAAERRIGRFEAAHGGTIFLDEVGELPLEAQVALLRVLQEREIERLGGGRPIRVDVRVIAATNRDLEAAVAAGTFRQDLYYRLDVFPIRVPPLRERGDDVVLLAERFVDEHGRRIGKWFAAIDEATLSALRLHPWPGNVRELENVIERGVILCEGEVFSLEGIWSPDAPSRAPQHRRSSLAAMIADRERELIEEALRESRGRVAGASGAARRLGIPPSTLESKIAQKRIDKYRFRGSLRGASAPICHAAP